VAIQRGPNTIEWDNNQRGLMDKIRQTFGIQDWILVDGNGRKRPIEKLKDGWTYQLRLEDELGLPPPDFETGSKFTIKGGRKWIRCNVELDQKIHETFVKDGDRRNFIQVLCSIGGAKYYAVEGKTPEASWEGQTIKITTKGKSSGISFYATLKTGDKESETVQIFARKGERIGWVKAMVEMRLGIHDFYFRGAQDGVDESWQDKCLDVLCRVRGVQKS
jgi:hypothetical protein